MKLFDFIWWIFLIIILIRIEVKYSAPLILLVVGYYSAKWYAKKYKNKKTKYDRFVDKMYKKRA